MNSSYMCARLSIRMTTFLAILSARFAITGVYSFSLNTASRPQIGHSVWKPRPAENIILFASVEDKPSTDEPSVDTKAPSKAKKKRKFLAIHKLPKAAYQVYSSYVRQLWKETDVAARMEVADDKVVGAIRNMQHILSCNEYNAFSAKGLHSQEELLKACDNMLAALAEERKEVVDDKIQEPKVSKEIPAAGRSVMFGALMGAAVACWVFSGNYVFTALFTLMTILGQLEYYRMMMKTGVYPARRISVIGASSMFLTVSLTFRYIG